MKAIISGTVTPAGAVADGETVTISGALTGTTTVSGNSFGFTSDDLAPGNYSIQVDIAATATHNAGTATATFTVPQPTPPPPAPVDISIALNVTLQ